jgi:hypothetical protein
MCVGSNNVKMCVGFSRHILIGYIDKHEKKKWSQYLCTMPAFKALLRDLKLNSWGIMKLGADVNGVKIRGKIEARLHWDRHQWH